MKNQALISRIKEMEGHYQALKEYMKSGQWQKDYEADEAGLVPAHLQRGVLSQDGLYNLLADVEALEPRGIIRRAEPRDLEAINRLLQQVLTVHHKGRPDLFKEIGKKYTDEELLCIFADDCTPVFVYEDDGEVLGYAFCAEKEQGSGRLMPLRTLYIDDLCVDEKARGRHVGKALFAHVKAYAKEGGFYNITLHVWECNPGARAFYEAQGMSPQHTTMEIVL